MYCKNHGFIDPNTKITKFLSYPNLIGFLKNHIQPTDLVRPYYFDAVKSTPEPSKVLFLEKLRDIGVNVDTKLLRSGRRYCPNCKSSPTVEFQKGVDVSLATHVMHLAFEDAYDICIIVSGDADYCTAIEYIKRKGKRVWVACFRDSLAKELRQTADKAIFLDDFFEELAMRNGNV